MNRSGRNSRGRRAQAGFSLIIIFLLLALMAAAATAVLLATRTDVRIAGRHRETTLAFFSAEAGIAYAKNHLAERWNGTTYWTSVLTEPMNTTTYNVGGIQVGPGDMLPLLNSRYIYSFANNPDDTSGDPLIDSDGRVVITAIGQAMGRAGNKVLAQVTLQVEVQWTAVTLLKGDYSAQQGQSASGVSNSPDSAGVDLSARRSF